MPKQKSNIGGKAAILEGIGGVRDDSRRSTSRKGSGTRAKNRRSVGENRLQTPITYAEIAQKYAQDVVSGTIPACKWVKLACQRQISDLERQNTAEFPWKFNPDYAQRICSFVERSPHIKGPLRGQFIHLEPWQCFCLTTVWGWVDAAGNRRFREAYIEVPGGNGKTALSAPIGNFMAFVDGEGGAEVYAAATSREQAKLVFESAQHMARGMPEFCARFGVDVLAHAIYQQASASRFIPMSAEAGYSQGINVHCAIIDELHAHPNREVYDVIKNHMGKRAQPLVWIITTAGSNRAGVCYEVRDYITKILEGVFKDDRMFGIVYTVDDDDDWALEASWTKANPNWGISVFPDAFAAEATQALQVASKQPPFKTKHLNIWVNADHAWMDMQRWSQCADPELDISRFAGKDCIIGLDLASKLDLLAKIKLFWEDIDEKRHWYAFGDYWTPKARLEHTQNSQYRGWALEGRLHTCRGETNDYDAVEDSIREDCRTYTVLEVAHDPYQAIELTNHLQEEGIVMPAIEQIPKNLSEPMKELEAAVYDRRFHFDGDPILTWAISNVVCHFDRRDYLSPTKERFENKIDPASALLTALNRGIVIEPADSYPLAIL
jgi:phage terminase large subunit-like protein